MICWIHENYWGAIKAPLFVPGLSGPFGDQNMCRSVSAVLVIAVGCSLAGQARADGIVQFRAQLWGSGAGFNGGPFQFQVISGLHPIGLGRYMTGAVGNTAERNASFATFCLEYSEEINFGATYHASVAPYAVAGGLSNTPGDGGIQPPASGLGDDLDYRTAFLYTKFMNGQLDDLVPAFHYPGDGSGRELQRAIWFIEGEQTSVTGLASTLVQAANAAVVGGKWGTTLGNVRVMNLFDNGGANKQSQLIMIPLPVGSGMAAVGSVCLVGAGVCRRRRTPLV